MPTARRALLFIASLMTLAAVLLTSQTAEASHFRYGTISWTVPDPVSAPLTVEFTVQTAWRASAVDGSQLQFGDGNVNPFVVGATIGTGVDVNGNAYTVTEYSVTHTYAAAGSFTPFFQSCCRVSGLQNGSSANFRVETQVDLSNGNTGGPVTASQPLIQMQIGTTRTYSFPVFDPDGDPVSCRFATAAESGLPAGQELPAIPADNSQPTVAFVNPDCVLTWDLTNAVAGQQYVVHLIMESNHLGVVSKTAVDLIVEMVTPPPPSCAGGGTFTAEAGQPFAVTVTGNDTTTSSLTRNVTNLPASATLSPTGTTQSTPFATTMSWTPGAADQGSSRIVLFNYTNSLNLSGSCAVTIFVPQCANFGDPCSAGTGECAATGTNVCVGNTTVCNAVTGTPTAELCDGLDNDCDGNIDNGNPESAQNCSTGLPGICDVGSTDCQAGALVCLTVTAPGTVAETCDNLDNDCDGSVDNGNPGSGVVCSSGQPGVCDAGTTDCQAGGVLACVPNIAPGSQTETCDNLDNDCDGNVDNGNPGSGIACSSGQPGVCDAGTTDCQAGGVLACVPNIAPGSQTETCDNLDNDCDGNIDNGDPGGGVSCSSGAPGVCDAGTTACQAGGLLACVPNIAIGSQTELCDNLDNDCDGNIDNGNPGSGATCSSGAPGICDMGTTDCQAGGVLACVPDIAPGTVAETCDNLDNDCDGNIDNGNPESGMACSSGAAGICDAGMTDCQAGGVLACISTIMPGTVAETCDNLDNDCDGAVDNGDPGGGVQCNSGLPGVCGPGATFCDVGGTIGCAPTITPGSQMEVCGSQLDEDCDGVLNNGCTDTDGDGIIDVVEVEIGSDPNDADTDDDGVLDGQEPSACIAYAACFNDSDGDGLLNVLDPDSDNDGLFDGTEMGLDCSHAATDAAAGACTPDGDMGATTTDPLNPDSDNGGVIDGSEDTNLNGVVDAGEIDPNVGADDNTVIDTDGDGLSDDLENTLGSDPNDADTDDDGIIDGDEANFSHDTDGDGLINVLDSDSDNDGLFDGTEAGLDCSNPATDVTQGQCTPDGDAGATTTNPLLSDTDGGGVSDGNEDANLNGVIDGAEIDPNDGSDDVITDTDGDGLSDDLENQIGTDPNDADSDDDGVVDGDEPNFASDTDGDGLINALDSDSDNDGLFDGTEMGLDCSNPDTDSSLGQCTPDGDAGATTTSPIDADSDDGGVIDGVEDTNMNGVVDAGEIDPNDGSDDSSIIDTDGDGLSDAVEEIYGTDPNDADSDDDGIIDGLEPNPSVDSDGDGLINALDPDSDNDGLFDGTEMGFDCSHADTDVSVGNCVPDADGGATTTSPLDADSDDGGVTDGAEDANGNGIIDGNETDPNEGSDDVGIVDTDGDGLSDDQEISLGTDPNDADSDDDGVPDGDELNLSADTDGDGLINALDPDSDNDGLFDGTEMGLDCSNPDTDVAAGNCIPDGDSGATTTSPLDADTDDGGVSDGDEDLDKDGVVDDGETDPNDGSDDLNVDTDGDGLTDAEEISLGTDPGDGDSDDDGVLDGDEPNPGDDTDGDGLINALDPDSDNDGIKDGTELGNDCDDPDTDASAGDCVPDGDGGATTTDPLNDDTDGGGKSDGEEDANFNGVIDEGETDPNVPADDVEEQLEDPNEGVFVSGNGILCTSTGVPNAPKMPWSAWMLVGLGAALVRRRRQSSKRASR